MVWIHETVKSLYKMLWFFFCTNCSELMKNVKMLKWDVVSSSSSLSEILPYIWYRTVCLTILTIQLRNSRIAGEKKKKKLFLFSLGNLLHPYFYLSGGNLLCYDYERGICLAAGSSTLANIFDALWGGIKTQSVISQTISKNISVFFFHLQLLFSATSRVVKKGWTWPTKSMEKSFTKCQIWKNFEKKI